MIVVAIGVIVPTLALKIANLINQELIIAYQVAARSNAIVTSLFPAQIKDRLLADDKSKLKSFLATGSEEDGENDDMMNIEKSKPIADLFTDTTIMFADIVGFTAWSSAREPSQVFTLLETVYHAFDEISSKYGAFKIETVGYVEHTGRNNPHCVNHLFSPLSFHLFSPNSSDCYGTSHMKGLPIQPYCVKLFLTFFVSFLFSPVAVSGLPEPRKDHAVVMCRVAKECLYQMNRLTTRLESVLGPDTGDLNIRIGLHR